VKNDDEIKQLLRILIRIVARSAIPPEQILRIVAGKAPSRKQIKAYNLCDGTRTQSQIVAELRLDQGNFSRTFARWEAAGVAFGTGEGRERRLLHLYPLPEAPLKQKRNE
jgi:hypothetical protein